ncbi:MAG: hypothetical protein QXE79_05345 [Candidatus Bathyarchaeia archaeon]
MAYQVGPALKSTATAVNAALYAGVGLLTYLGVFAPIVGVVRFWGVAVVVPAVFAAIFGPLVGGIGAAIGIFITDLLIHGDALLSLTVGVPANFIMFALIGLLSNRRLNPKIWVASAAIIASILYILTWIVGGGGVGASALIVVAALTVVVLLIFQRWREVTSFTVSTVLGNALGSLIVGFGVWGYSQFFALPMTMGKGLPVVAALTWFTWTFSNQMPFLLILAPPIVKAAWRTLRGFAAAERIIEAEAVPYGQP